VTRLARRLQILKAVIVIVDDVIAVGRFSDAAPIPKLALPVVTSKNCGSTMRPVDWQA
jgi:hypothetical protein